MKLSVFKHAFITTSLTLLAIFGTLAQTSIRILDRDTILPHVIFKDWVIPKHSCKFSASTGSKLGNIYVGQYDTKMPYVEVVKFYDTKFGHVPDEKWLTESSDFNAPGYTGGPENGIESINNRPNALSATFVYLYPRSTITVTLNRAACEDRTHITVTHIDSSNRGKGWAHNK